jgi:hypothetical protein
MIKSRRISLAGHAAHMGEKWSVYKVLVGKLEERDHYEGTNTDGRITLK